MKNLRFLCFAIVLGFGFSAFSQLARADESPVVKAQLSVPVATELQTPKKTEAMPMQIIKDTVQQVIKINSELQGENNTKPRRDKLREIINPHFDFREMAKRSLGAHWDKITVEEQRDFIDVFSNLLAKTYLARIDTVTTNVVQYNSEKIEPPTALVKTTINHKGDDFPIDYKMLKEESGWKVYDVVIENIGMVANYRNEFAGVIRKEQFAGLMKRLRSKSEG